MCSFSTLNRKSDLKKNDGIMYAALTAYRRRRRRRAARKARGWQGVAVIWVGRLAALAKWRRTLSCSAS
jgi:hypothetical protein